MKLWYYGGPPGPKIRAEKEKFELKLAKQELDVPAEPELYDDPNDWMESMMFYELDYHNWIWSSS